MNRWQDSASALVVIFGIYLMVPAFDPGNEIFLGVAWGLFSALMFSLRNIIQRRKLSTYTAQQTLFYQTLVILVAVLPFSAVPVDEVSTWQWGQLLVLGVFFTALPHSLFMHGLRFLKAKTVSLIACLQVVHSSLFAAILLGEWPATHVVAGGLVVFAAAVYETYYARRQGDPRYTAAPSKD